MGPRSHSLQTIPFFIGLPADRLAELEAKCRWRSCSAGDTIINHLDSSDDVCFLTSGRARVIIYSDAGKVVAFRDIKVGDIFGELAAIDGEPRSASIEAVEPSTVAYMRKEEFWRTIRTEAVFMEALIKHLAHQARALTARIFEFSTLAVSNRIQAEILRLAREDLDEMGIGHIRPIPQHSQIASRVSTTREAVARELSHLVRLGVLRRTAGELQVLDIGRLSEMIEKASAV